MRWRVLLAVVPSLVMTSACTRSTTSVPPSDPAHELSLVSSPAPRPSGAFDQCPFGVPRASQIPPANLAATMRAHVPHWLPDGMGLVEAFGPGEGSLGGAYFADKNCREVELWFWESSDVGAGPLVGPWTVNTDVPDGCGNAVLGGGRCLDYSVDVEGGSIGVQMMGIPRSEGDQVVQSIPV